MLLANRSFNNLFDDMFSDPFFTRSYDRSSSQVMRTDIHETGDHYMIEIELPGYAKEEIKADLKDGYLTITAHKNETKEEKEARGKCIHKERYTGTCNRSFYVGEDITQEDIKAAFKDGVLRLQLPKEVEKQEEQPKLITIDRSLLFSSACAASTVPRPCYRTRRNRPEACWPCPSCPWWSCCRGFRRSPWASSAGSGK